MKTPALRRVVESIAAVRERSRLLVEGLGAVLIVCALLMVSIPLGIAVAGVVLVVIANFYMGAEDAGADDGNAEDPAQRR